MDNLKQKYNLLNNIVHDSVRIVHDFYLSSIDIR